MMDKYTIEERLERLDSAQLSEVACYLSKLSLSEEKIDFNSLSCEYKGLLKHFSKLSNNEKMIFLEYVKEFVKENLRNNTSNISEKLDNSRFHIENKWLSKTPKIVNKEDVLRRVDKLSVSEKVSLSHYFRLVIDEAEFDSNQIPMRIQGLVKLFKKVNTKDRIKVLEFVREKLLTESYDDKILADLFLAINHYIFVEKKKCISEIIERSNNFNPAYQSEFIDEVYQKVLSTYSYFAKNNRVNSCEHSFSEWKDYSYTLEEDTIIDREHTRVPVEHILFKKKCKKCGYVEVVDYIPQEVVENRKKEERRQKIKQLRKELKQLEDED